MRKLDVPPLFLTARQLAIVRAINTDNAEFWAKHEEPPPPVPGVALPVAEAWRLTIRAQQEQHEAVLAIAAAQRETVRASNRARALKAARASAEKRGQDKSERNRRIHDLLAQGKTPKQITADEKLDVTTVRKIRKILARTDNVVKPTADHLGK